MHAKVLFRVKDVKVVDPVRHIVKGPLESAGSVGISRRWILKLRAAWFRAYRYAYNRRELERFELLELLVEWPNNGGLRAGVCGKIDGAANDGHRENMDGARRCNGEPLEVSAERNTPNSRVCHSTNECVQMPRGE